MSAGGLLLILFTGWALLWAIVMLVIYLGEALAAYRRRRAVRAAAAFNEDFRAAIEAERAPRPRVGGWM